MRQFAGEGVDNIIMTDHHAHTDLTPRIADLGFTAFVTATIGEEITTWDTGHYNAYPLLIDPTRPSGGSTDWGGAAPAGQDFPSLGNYILNPVDIDALAKTGPTATADTIVQINHIDSHFVPMQIDTSLVPPQSFIDAGGAPQFPHGPGERQPLPPLRGARALERPQPQPSIAVPERAHRRVVQPAEPGSASPP